MKRLSRIHWAVKLHLEQRLVGELPSPADVILFKRDVRIPLNPVSSSLDLVFLRGSGAIRSSDDSDVNTGFVPSVGSKHSAVYGCAWNKAEHGVLVSERQRRTCTVKDPITSACKTAGA
jgi:hypothetical protein